LLGRVEAPHADAPVDPGDPKGVTVDHSRNTAAKGTWAGRDKESFRVGRRLRVTGSDLGAGRGRKEEPGQETGKTLGAKIANRPTDHHRPAPARRLCHRALSA
jgi:hypothetical protein